MTTCKRRFILLIIALLCVLTFTGCGENSKAAPVTQSAESQQPLPVDSGSSGELKVSYLDVGQGDSIFLELPDSKTMLIDAGNPENASFVSAYIRSAGYSKIDYVVATHPHDDHIGGLPEVVKAFEIGAIYMPKVGSNTASFEKLLTEIERKGYKITTARAGVNILQDGILRIDILAPVKDSYRDLNNYSAVIKLVYGSTSFIFMGDAEKLSERQITADVNSDVLKVGHHGSDYSSGSSFIKKVSPRFAVISVGKDNDYGHPSSKTLTALAKNKVTTYRTDLEGTIVFRSDGAAITEETDSNRELESESEPIPGAPAAAPAGLMNSPKQSEMISDQVVYITKTGSKYHREDCPYLSESKISIPLSEAKLNYEPCGKCDPPQ